MPGQNILMIFMKYSGSKRGYCLHRLNGVETLLGRGDIVFLNPGDKHSGDAVKEDRLVHMIFKALPISINVLKADMVKHLENTEKTIDPFYPNRTNT